jgi:hypothetical protein
MSFGLICYIDLVPRVKSVALSKKGFIADLAMLRYAETVVHRRVYSTLVGCDPTLAADSILDGQLFRLFPGFRLLEKTVGTYPL